MAFVDSGASRGLMVTNLFVRHFVPWIVVRKVELANGLEIRAGHTTLGSIQFGALFEVFWARCRGTGDSFLETCMGALGPQVQMPADRTVAAAVRAD